MPYIPFKKAAKFITRSRFVKIFFSGSECGRAPDVVDFFSAFGVKLFSASVDIDCILEQPIYDLVFQPVNQIILESIAVDTKSTEAKKIITGYYTKCIYWEDPSGQSWHTPIYVMDDENDQKFSLIKGINKVLAAKLAGLKSLPALIGSQQKKSSIEHGKEIKSDRNLVDFLIATSNNRVQDPEIGIEFRTTHNECPIPVIHWITVFPEAAERVDIDILWAKDLELWKNFYHSRVVFSDVFPSVRTHGLDYEIPPIKLHTVDQVRRFMPHGSVAYIDSDGDSEICSRLSQALVWLSSDRFGNAVGTAVSHDGRYRVVFNNTSDLTVIIPPGIVDLRCQ
jgi:hypothetical protein